MIKACHPWVAKVLLSGGLTKHIALMRELMFVTASPDLEATAILCVGSRMMGESLSIKSMPHRRWNPEITVEEFADGSEERNQKVMRFAEKHEDEELAKLSWAKSIEEADRGVLLGPYEEFDHIPLPDVSLCWRKAVWESRGGAEWSARNIDDMLLSGQNETAG